MGRHGVTCTYALPGWMAALLGCFSTFGVMHVIVVAVGILPAPSQALGHQTNWCDVVVSLSQWSLRMCLFPPVHS